MGEDSELIVIPAEGNPDSESVKGEVVFQPRQVGVISKFGEGVVYEVGVEPVKGSEVLRKRGESAPCQDGGARGAVG
jgi:hypothetical protein